MPQTSGQVYRTRPVIVSGTVDLAAGLAAVGFGSALASSPSSSSHLAYGLAAVVLGFLLFVAGLGRVTSRLEVHGTELVWVWSFSRRRLPFAELSESALVEPGSPDPGGESGGFVGGGVLAVVGWRLFAIGRSLLTSRPTLGPYGLVVLPHHGAPVRIRPIGSFATRPEFSEAGTARRAVQDALEAYQYAESTSARNVMPQRAGVQVARGA